MGKKTKKKAPKQQQNGGVKSRQDDTAAADNQTKPDIPASKKQQQQQHQQQTRSLYSIYKYCTEAVMEWGRTTYKKTKMGRKKKISEESTLTAIVFDCLGSLVDVGVPMPDTILNHLRTAISYRKRVSLYYRSIPTAKEKDHASHLWLIEQLERLEAHFSKLNTAEEDGVKSTDFAVLASERTDDQYNHLESQEEELDEPEANRNKPRPPAPTPEELEAEERMFAISLVLAEIGDARADLKEIWRDWAAGFSTKQNTQAENGADLLAVTACTEYAVAALRKLILQTTIEFPSIGQSFDQILQSFGQATIDCLDQPENVAVGDCVTIRNLEKRPDLNGKHGKVTKIIKDTRRLAVELFLQGSDGYADTTSKRPTLSIKPENLVLSDNLCLRLGQIHDSLEAFRWDSCPAPPESVLNAPASVEVVMAAVEAVAKLGNNVINNVAKDQDFVGFLNLFVAYILPQFVSFARYTPDTGAADAVLIAYLRDFAKTKQLHFHFALALLVVVDGAFVTAESNGKIGDDARDLFVKILGEMYNNNTYNETIQLLRRGNKKPDALYSHFESARHFQEEYSEMCSYSPWASGTLLLMGLRLHFVCGSGIPYCQVGEYTAMLHLYWMLRVEGAIGPLMEIETTLIRMYRQQVWFRGGLPRKGEENYLKLWQVAAGGLNLRSARLMDGRSTARAVPTRAVKEMTGLHVTEMSRLLDVLQWKSMPITDRSACYKQIQQIAREEYHILFTAPLMDVCLKMSHLQDSLSSKSMVATARSSGHRMIEDFSTITRGMFDVSVVCFWGLCLGDNRSPNAQEKAIGLSLLAREFRNIFQEKAIGGEQEGATPSLTFSPNDHAVDKSLWGEQGARRMEHLQLVETIVYRLSMDTLVKLFGKMAISEAPSELDEDETLRKQFESAEYDDSDDSERRPLGGEDTSVNSNSSYRELRSAKTSSNANGITGLHTWGQAYLLIPDGRTVQSESKEKRLNEEHKQLCAEVAVGAQGSVEVQLNFANVAPYSEALGPNGRSFNNSKTLNPSAHIMEEQNSLELHGDASSKKDEDSSEEGSDNSPVVGNEVEEGVDYEPVKKRLLVLKQRVFNCLTRFSQWKDMLSGTQLSGKVRQNDKARAPAPTVTPLKKSVDFRSTSEATQTNLLLSYDASNPNGSAMVSSVAASRAVPPLIGEHLKSSTKVSSLIFEPPGAAPSLMVTKSSNLPESVASQSAAAPCPAPFPVVPPYIGDNFKPPSQACSQHFPPPHPSSNLPVSGLARPAMPHSPAPVPITPPLIGGCRDLKSPKQGSSQIFPAPCPVPLSTATLTYPPENGQSLKSESNPTSLDDNKAPSPTPSLSAYPLVCSPLGSAAVTAQGARVPSPAPSPCMSTVADSYASVASRGNARSSASPFALSPLQDLRKSDGPSKSSQLPKAARDNDAEEMKKPPRASADKPPVTGSGAGLNVARESYAADFATPVKGSTTTTAKQRKNAKKRAKKRSAKHKEQRRPVVDEATKPASKENNAEEKEKDLKKRVVKEVGILPCASKRQKQEQSKAPAQRGNGKSRDQKSDHLFDPAKPKPNEIPSPTSSARALELSKCERSEPVAAKQCSGGTGLRNNPNPTTGGNATFHGTASPSASSSLMPSLNEVCIILDSTNDVAKFLTPLRLNLALFWDLVSSSSKEELRVSMVTPSNQVDFTNDKQQVLSVFDTLDKKHESREDELSVIAGLEGAMQRLAGLSWSPGSTRYIYIFTNLSAWDCDDHSLRLKLQQALWGFTRHFPVDVETFVGAWADAKANAVLEEALTRASKNFRRFSFLDAKEMSLFLVQDRGLLQGVLASLKSTNRKPTNARVRIAIDDQGTGKDVNAKAAGEYIEKTGEIVSQAKTLRIKPLETIHDVLADARSSFDRQDCWMKRKMEPHQVNYDEVYWVGKLGWEEGAWEKDVMLKALKLDEINGERGEESEAHHRNRAYVAEVAKFLAIKYNEEHRPDNCAKIEFLAGCVIEDASAERPQVFYAEELLTDDDWIPEFTLFCDCAGQWDESVVDESLLRFALTCFTLSGGDFMVSGFRGVRRGETYTLTAPSLLLGTVGEAHARQCTKEYIKEFRKGTKLLMEKNGWSMKKPTAKQVQVVHAAGS